MSNEHMKGASTLLVIREMQMETRVKYSHTPFRMAKMAKLNILRAGEHVEEQSHWSSAGGNINGYNHLRKLLSSFLED